MNLQLNPSLAYSQERVIGPRRGLVGVNFRELWRYRELFLFLCWRDILVRYKQTLLGVAWAVLQPVLMTVVFTLVFGKLGGFPDEGVPYAILTLAGLLPWNYFANAMSESSNSLVASANMISKIYFPRLIVPASSILSGIVDFLISLVLLFGFMIWYKVPVHGRMLLLPLFFLMEFMAALAVGVWLSALNVKYRDVKYVVPFFTRIGLYATPVGFASSIILKRFGPKVYLFYCLNPMVGVIDGFRWCILGVKFEPYWPGVLASSVMTAVLLSSGLIYFRNTERKFADVI